MSAEGRQTAGRDAKFLVYSITKTLLATAALRLVATGDLSLDAPLARWLPDAPHAGIVTPRNLLHHDSGLPDYGGLREYHDAVRRGDEPWSDDEFVARTGAADRLLFAPGEGWAYSNVGYMLVKRLLEAIRGAGFGDVLRAEIFEPLRLTETFVPTDADLPRLTFGPSAYLGGDGPGVDVAERYRLGWVAHGVVVSTAEEVARFYHALFEGELLPPELLEEMCRARSFDPIPGRPWVRPGYGLGLQVDGGAPGGPIYGHTGGGPGCSASAVYQRTPSGGVAAAVLAASEDVAEAERRAITILGGDAAES